MLWKLGPEDKSDGQVCFFDICFISYVFFLQYLAVTDFPYVHEVDPDTFAVKAKYGLNMMEGISMSSSAHWRREVNKDSSLQFHMIYNPITMKADFALYRFHSTWEEREVVSKFEIPHTSVVHMFSNTENYAVVALYPE